MAYLEPTLLEKVREGGFCVLDEVDFRDRDQNPIFLPTESEPIIDFLPEYESRIDFVTNWWINGWTLKYGILYDELDYWIARENADSK